MCPEIASRRTYSIIFAGAEMRLTVLFCFFLEIGVMFAAFTVLIGNVFVCVFFFLFLSSIERMISVVFVYFMLSHAVEISKNKCLGPAFFA